jgi:NADH:ubiquinone oxidoreductase subunit 4 (subunit M)
MSPNSPLPILSLLTFAPLVGAALVLLLPKDSKCAI